MVHRLFTTDFQVSKAEYEAQKPRLMAYQYHELDDALGMAREIEARGGIAWEIENDDGQTMGRDEIQAQLRARRAELVGRTQSPLTGSSVSAAELADANRGIFIRNAEMRGMPSA
jgi:hypothetical protein